MKGSKRKTGGKVFDAHERFRRILETHAINHENKVHAPVMMPDSSVPPEVGSRECDMPKVAETGFRPPSVEDIRLLIAGKLHGVGDYYVRLRRNRCAQPGKT